MTFTIRMGIPDMAAFNDALTARARTGTLDRDETALFKQWRKALTNLAQNPRHPGLRTHVPQPGRHGRPTVRGVRTRERRDHRRRP